MNRANGGHSWATSRWKKWPGDTIRAGGAEPSAVYATNNSPLRANRIGRLTS